MRIPSLLLVGFLCLTGTLVAQEPDPATGQDEEAAREKILKASDQIDMMESNSEATKTAVDGLKADLAKLEDENAALKLQVASLQDAVQKMEDDRAKERQVLLDEVSKMVAARSSGEDRPAPKHHTQDGDASLTPPPDAPTSGPTNPIESAGTGEPAAPQSTAERADDSAAAASPPPHPRKGYSYTVEEGQTLTMICAAYRAEGVPVTVAEVRKANGLTEKSILKPGQKLFIPKPGT